MSILIALIFLFVAPLTLLVGTDNAIAAETSSDLEEAKARFADRLEQLRNKVDDFCDRTLPANEVQQAKQMFTEKQIVDFRAPPAIRKSVQDVQRAYRKQLLRLRQANVGDAAVLKELEAIENVMRVAPAPGLYEVQPFWFAPGTPPRKYLIKANATGFSFIAEPHAATSLLSSQCDLKWNAEKMVWEGVCSSRFSNDAEQQLKTANVTIEAQDQKHLISSAPLYRVHDSGLKETGGIGKSKWTLIQEQ